MAGEKVATKDQIEELKDSPLEGVGVLVARKGAAVDARTADRYKVATEDAPSRFRGRDVEGMAATASNEDLAASGGTVVTATGAGGATSARVGSKKGRK
jgi:hypothetical protein